MGEREIGTAKNDKVMQQDSGAEGMVKPSFVHLHLHTEYSLLDGLTKVKELVSRVKELGMPAVAVTDHGVMYGIPEFYFAARDVGIKPILGMEAYIVDDISQKEDIRARKRREDDTKWFYHLTLLARNKTGYKNLLKLTTIANTRGFYYKPLIDKKLLSKYSEGLIGLSGCPGGELAHLIRNHRTNKDKAIEVGAKVVQDYLAIFGKDSYFIELQRSTMGPDAQDEERFLEEVLLILAERFGLRYVATGDVHYLEPGDAEIQAIIMALRQGKKLKGEEAFTIGTDQLYLKTPQEMADLFKDIPDAVKNTVYIADLVEEYNIHYDRIEPKYPDVPNGMTEKEYLRQLVFEGAKKRYGKITPELKERLEYELSVIDQKGYNGYFLVVADYVKWAKRQGILVGPGRGSGGGSVVAYCIGITDIDPLEWGLLFDRFLNPYRPSPPDFDIDFQDDRRDEVIDYVRKRYGYEKVGAIGAIGRMDTRAAIRDVARVLDIPLQIVDKFSKLIPVKRGKPMPIQEALETVPELKELVNQNPELEKVVKVLTRIKKLARHISVHACGYLVTPKPMVEFVPLRRSPQSEDEIITQVEGKYIEKLGLMKFDFLGLRTLTIISHTLNAIRLHRGINLTLEEIYKNKKDKMAFKVFQKAETDGVFQLESQGMKNYLKQLHPTSLDDINFLLAAYRPGPLKYIPEYIDRKFGRKPLEYVHPDLESILKETYGFAIYQEQVLKIAVDIAGYSVGEADILRRAIGKKQKELLDKEKDRFFNGAMERGYSKEVVEKIWEFILPFADYGFNKSHSAAYTMISFYTAYLKGNYPVEFVYGLLSTDIDRPTRLEKDLEIAKRMHISLLRPDINKSDKGFTIEYINKRLEKRWLDDNFKVLLAKVEKRGRKGVLGEIRIGFAAVKGVSSKAIDMILEERKKRGAFKGIEDFLSRIDYSSVDKKSLLLLAKVGAFDDWGERMSMVKTIEENYDIFKEQFKRRSENQLSLLGIGAAGREMHLGVKMVRTQPATAAQILNWEKEAYGVYVSAHPFSQISDFLKAKGVTKIIEAIRDGKKQVRIAVFIRRIKKHTTSNGSIMAFADLEDDTALVDGVLFPKIYEEFAKDVILKYDLETTPLLLDGVLEPKPGVVGNSDDPSQYSFRVSAYEVVFFDEVAKRLAVDKEAFLEEVRSSSNHYDVGDKGRRNQNSKREGSVQSIPKVISLAIHRQLSKEQLYALRDLLSNNPGSIVLHIYTPDGKRYKYKRPVSKEVLSALAKYGIVRILK